MRGFETSPMIKSGAADWPQISSAVFLCVVQDGERRDSSFTPPTQEHHSLTRTDIYRAQTFILHMWVFSLCVCVCVCPWLTKWLTNALKASMILRRVWEHLHQGQKQTQPERNQYKPEKSTAVFGLGSLCCGRLPGWSSVVAKVFLVVVSLLVMSSC